MVLLAIVKCPLLVVRASNRSLNSLLTILDHLLTLSGQWIHFRVLCHERFLRFCHMELYFVVETSTIHLIPVNSKYNDDPSLSTPTSTPLPGPSPQKTFLSL
jgi:hypothetical protein